MFMNKERGKNAHYSMAELLPLYQPTISNYSSRETARLDRGLLLASERGAPVLPFADRAVEGGGVGG
jgi:hypothetical protein